MYVCMTYIYVRWLNLYENIPVYLSTSMYKIKLATHWKPHYGDILKLHEINLIKQYALNKKKKLINKTGKS